MATVKEKTHTTLVGLPAGLPPGARVKLLRAQGGLPAGAVLVVIAPKNAPKADAIGSMEAKTDRLILQNPKKPAEIQKKAKDEHEAAGAAIRAAIASVKGAELYAGRAGKDPERLAEKVAEGQSPRTMRDYSGFRVAVESPEAWKQTAAALRAHFEVPDEQDEFEKGSPVNFHGHTVQIRLAGSPVTHEVQILPREVAEHAEADHALYEKAREGDGEAERRLADRNRARWIAFLDRNGQAKYKFGSTQADIDPESEAGKGLEAARDRIAEEDLAGDGKETGGGDHITVRYGVRDSSDPEKLRAFLRGQPPFEATLGATEAFEPSEHSDGAAPIFAPVVSPDLHRIHGEIVRHGDFKSSDFAEYRPHATVAYVKPGAAKKYTGMPETEGKRVRISAISLSHRDGSVDRVALEGDSTAKGGSGTEPEPRAEAAEAASRPATLLGEKLRAALRKKQEERAASPRNSAPAKAAPAPKATQPETGGGWAVIPDGRGGFRKERAAGPLPQGALRVRAEARLLQPVTGTPEEAELMARYAPELAAWIADYLARNTVEGCTTLATDAAKKLLPAFAADPVRNGGDTTAVADAIRDGALETLLQAAPEPGKTEALVAIGSPGSGKTTSLALGGERPGVGIKLELIPDEGGKFAALLRQILASGRRPVVEWVWAGTPKTTVQRMVGRALGDGRRPGIGRVVPIQYMAKAWAALPQAIEDARRDLGPRVTWLVADNSGPPGTAKVSGDLGQTLKHAGRLTADEAHDRMAGELDALDRRGRTEGETGQAVLAAARARHAHLPRREEVRAAPDPREKLRWLAESRRGGGPSEASTIRTREQRAWQQAGETLRNSPTAQVPF